MKIISQLAEIIGSDFIYLVKLLLRKICLFFFYIYKTVIIAKFSKVYPSLANFSPV